MTKPNMMWQESMLSSHINSMQENKSKINFISILRGPAALLVMWDHLVGTYLDQSGQSWRLLELVRNYVTKPLAIIQDFGFFAVALFFLISGFIITYIAQRETALQFTVRRIFRIYPPPHSINFDSGTFGRKSTFDTRNTIFNDIIELFFFATERRARCCMDFGN